MSRQPGYSSCPSPGSGPSPLQSPAAERSFQLPAVHPDQRARLPALQQQQQPFQQQLPSLQSSAQSPKSSDDGTVKSRKSSYASLAGGFRTAAAAEAAASAGSASANAPSSDVESKQRATSRSLGVESMLNPQREPKAGTGGRRRSAVEMQRSSPGQQPAPPTLHRTASTGSQVATYLPGPSPSAVPPRRTLTPRSPSRRAASLSGMSPTGTIDARQSPFLVSQPHRYTVEPGVAGAPPLPTQSLPPPSSATSAAPTTAPVFATGSRVGHGFPFSATATPPLPLTAGARRSTIAAIAPTRGTHSESVSPTTSTASYNQVEQRSPVQRLPALNAITGSMPGSTAGPGVLPGHVGLDLGRGYGFSMSGAVSAGVGTVSGGNGGGGQGNYRLLTLATQQGPVQVPVDVQAASRLATEKRKRNAGASARFRQRRKEKEREATSTIQRLEQQLRDASEDVEFYRRERDLVVSVLVQHYPHGPSERLFPRPTSPRHSRRERVERDQQQQRLEQEQRQRREDEEAEDLEALRAAQRLHPASYMASAPSSAPASAGPYLTRFSDQKVKTEDEKVAQYYQQQYFRPGASTLSGPPPSGSAMAPGQPPGYVPLPSGAGAIHSSYANVARGAPLMYNVSGLTAADESSGQQQVRTEAGAGRHMSTNVGVPPKSNRPPVSLPPPPPASPHPSAQAQAAYQYSNPDPVPTSLPPMVAGSASSSFSSMTEQLPPVPQQSNPSARPTVPKPDGGWPPGTAR